MFFLIILKVRKTIITHNWYPISVKNVTMVRFPPIKYTHAPK